MRTAALATLISLSVALIALLLVLLIRPAHPAPTASSGPAVPATPADLTVRALVTPTPAATATAPTPTPANSASTPETQTVLTANLYLARSGHGSLVPTGQAAIRCTRVSQNAITALCDGQALTAYGQLTFAGAMIESDALADPPASDLSFAITGGTGGYAAVRGTLEITALTHTTQDWVFHFAPPPGQ